MQTQLLHAFADLGQGLIDLVDQAGLQLPPGDRNADRRGVQLVAQLMPLLSGQGLRHFCRCSGGLRIESLFFSQLLAENDHVCGGVDAQADAVPLDVQHLDRGADGRQENFFVVTPG